LISALAKGFSDGGQGRGNVRGLKEVRTRQNATREEQGWMNVRVSRYCKSTPGNKHIMRLTKRSRKEFGTETKNSMEEGSRDTLRRELTKMLQMSSVKTY